MIGIQTTFYGYRGDVVEKTKKLIGIFESLGMPPFVQIGPSTVDAEFETVVSQLNTLKDKHGVEYSVHQSIWLPSPDFFPNLGSSSAVVKRETYNSLKRSVDFAQEIGAKNLSFHAGCAANKMSQEEEFEPLNIADSIHYAEAYSNFRKMLQRLLKCAKGGVALSVENFNYRPERRYLFSNPRDFAKLPKEVNVLFDVAHAYFSQIRSKNPSYLKEMIEIVGGKISEIHASDNDGSEDQHRLPGHGKVKFSEIFRWVANKQRMPPVIVEATKGKNGHSEDDLKKSIRSLAKILDDI